MDNARHFLALLMVATIPAAFAMWFAIHPFVGFWRRLGPGKTYGIVGAAVLGVASALFMMRSSLVTGDLGTSWPAVAGGLVLLAAAGAIAWTRRKHLTFRILVGLPELSLEPTATKLLTEGPYAVVRHPRYVESMLAVAGYALISNYVAAYVAAALTIVELFAIVHFEEHELLKRFGDKYRRYAERVPRFVPRFR